MQKFLEGLTATHDASFFHEEARRLGNPIRKDIRGSPLNTGESLQAIHPVIRTNRELLSPLTPVHRFNLLRLYSCNGLEVCLRQQRIH